MLTEFEKSCVIDLLKDLEPNDVMELAKTITTGIFHSDSVEDSINAILLHTSDIKSLLWRKKVTKAVLFKYLHKRNVSFPGNAEKALLVDILIDIWQKRTAVVSSNEAQEASGQTGTVRCLAIKFTEWFYNRVNATVMQKMINVNNVSSDFESLREEDFWCDSKIIINLTNGSGQLIAEYNSQGSKECVDLISQLCTEYSLHFSPNLCEEGTRGVTEPHGLVLVISCGTLHTINDRHCVGLYEQSFGLIKDPMSDDNWKIKHSKLILRSQDVKSSLSTGLSVTESTSMQ